jgi:hypothetical protein
MGGREGGGHDYILRRIIVLHNRCKCVLLQPHLDTSMLLVAVPFRGSAESMTRQHTGSQISTTTTPSLRLLEIMRDSASVRILAGQRWESFFFFTCQTNIQRFRCCQRGTAPAAPRPSVPVSLLRLGTLSRTTFLRNTFSPHRLFGYCDCEFLRIKFRKNDCEFCPPPPRQPRLTLDPRNMLHRELPRIFHLVSLPYIISVIASGAKR